jgi:hypothetical protein
MTSDINHLNTVTNLRYINKFNDLILSHRDKSVSMRQNNSLTLHTKQMTSYCENEKMYTNNQCSQNANVFMLTMAAQRQKRSL